MNPLLVEPDPILKTIFQDFYYALAAIPVMILAAIGAVRDLSRGKPLIYAWGKIISGTVAFGWLVFFFWKWVIPHEVIVDVNQIRAEQSTRIENVEVVGALNCKVKLRPGFEIPMTARRVTSLKNTMPAAILIEGECSEIDDFMREMHILSKTLGIQNFTAEKWRKAADSQMDFKKPLFVQKSPREKVYLLVAQERQGKFTPCVIIEK